MDSMMKQKPITAAELMAGLNEDIDFVEAQRARDERRFLANEQRARDEAPVLADLHAVGVMVHSVWDIVNKKASFPAALPVLLKHLRLPYPDAVREGLARAMSERAANFAWNDLVAMYAATDNSNVRVKDGLAVALAGAVGPEQLDELVALIRDTRNGASRVLLTIGLRLLSAEKQLKLFEEFSNDPEIAPEANDKVKKLRKRLARAKNAQQAAR
jgi:hypothetical protein